MAKSEWEQMHSGSGAHSPAERQRCSRLAVLLTFAALRDKDWATMVTVKSRHPQSASDYLELARLCRRAGKETEAMDWAQRGVQAFPLSETESLYEFLIEDFEASENWKEALEMHFARFWARPSLSGYQRIGAAAERAGEWAQWRTSALNILQQNSEADASALVSVLLWEKEDEAAWLVAKQNGCRDDLWLEVAKRRERQNPEDALFIYRQLVAQYARRKNRYSYEQAVQTLRRMARLLRKLKRAEEFLPFVEGLCRQYRYQHALVKMLRQLMSRHSSRKNSERS